MFIKNIGDYLKRMLLPGSEIRQAEGLKKAEVLSEIDRIIQGSDPHIPQAFI